LIEKFNVSVYKTNCYCNILLIVILGPMGVGDVWSTSTNCYCNIVTNSFIGPIYC